VGSGGCWVKRKERERERKKKRTFSSFCHAFLSLRANISFHVWFDDMLTVAPSHHLPHERHVANDSPLQ